MSNKRASDTTERDLPAENTQVVPAERAPKFTIERLRRDCFRIFGVTTSTFDGAAFGLTGEYTVEQMRERLCKWQNTRVVPAKKKEGN